MRVYIIDSNNADIDFVGPSEFTNGGNGLAVRPLDGTILNTPIDANGLVILNRNTRAGSVIPASVDNLPRRWALWISNPTMCYMEYKNHLEFVWPNWW
jgi:hypothetical protein